MAASIALPGTATPADILSGQTASSSAGFNFTGTMPNQGSPTLYPGDSITAGYYGGGSVAPIKVAYGSVTSSAATASFLDLSGATTNTASATIPVPSGAQQIIAVLAYDTGTNIRTYGTPLGYADGATASVLAMSGDVQIVAGDSLQLSTSGIVIPVIDLSTTVQYTVLYV